mmetsp:Transcript_33868/g.49793  ORF Transcript_33868/g.49793 Transcript_33868/m.49793 type:complete len:283 (+) Transcript_33868:213-1061(+)|eukprot:CAMPEP_0195521654 /NCGR_PEP_ID=MMETSP0794_2-20130614/19115_1 /TAXON_ID=515487 /ORGANISM="Stephanopyxis turris, Strain CCMP 815" /LENGTH=282 /DNA_ID=CAMNT_0040651259 /DNA_START=171 /DNA_END=1019 /DNA_ORIENTATION=-
MATSCKTAFVKFIIGAAFAIACYADPDVVQENTVTAPGASDVRDKFAHKIVWPLTPEEDHADGYEKASTQTRGGENPDENKPKATKIMIIRHAEGPNDKGKPKAINKDGHETAHSLIVRGWQRAGALVSLFRPFNLVFQNEALAVPDYLYALRTSNCVDSERPRDTIAPLSGRLDLNINQTFAKEEYKELVDAAMQQPGVVLISWIHEQIPCIANLILGTTKAPQKWDPHRFDLVFVFDLDPSTGSYTFSQVPQNLLEYDSFEIFEMGGNPPTDCAVCVSPK